MNYLLRSLMFVPAHNDRLMESASRSIADVLLLDIEDSVQPLENKQIARDKIVKYVKGGSFEKFHVFPRVNDRESGQLLQDLMQLTIPGVDGFMYPKSKDGKDIYFIDKLLETIEYEKNIPVGTFKLIPLIETASAALHAEEICAASERVIAIAFGCEDYIADLEGIHDHAGNSLEVPRAMIAMAARAQGKIPVDTVHINVHDLEDLEKNLIIAKNLGFEGMLILHPKEITLAHQYFSPSESEVKDAKEMLELFDEAQKTGKGVAILNNKFIGPPMVITAKKTLEKQKLIDSKNTENNTM